MGIQREIGKRVMLALISSPCEQPTTLAGIPLTAYIE
jgi:hypothetical protein